MIFVIYKLGRLGLGEVRFGMCKLGEVSFEKYMLDYLGKVSFGMSYLSELSEFVNLEHEFGKLIIFFYSPENDFGYGNTDTFTASDFKTDGDCYNFNITRLTRLEIKRKIYNDDEENWLGEWMILESDNPDVKHRCTFDAWIPPNEISVPINCQPMLN